MGSRIDRLESGSLRCVAHTANATTSCVALNCVGTAVSAVPRRSNHYKKNKVTEAKVGKGDRGDRGASASHIPSTGNQLVVKQEPTKNYLVVLGKWPLPKLLFYTPVDEAAVNRGCCGRIYPHIGRVLKSKSSNVFLFSTNFFPVFAFYPVIAPLKP